MKKVEVVIDEFGDVSIDLVGFQGKGCSKVMDDFADGATAKFARNKREFNLAPAQVPEGQKA